MLNWHALHGDYNEVVRVSPTCVFINNAEAWRGYSLLWFAHHEAVSGTTIDLSRCMNFTNFDVIGSLCFGESFNALENENYGFWIANLFQGLKVGRMFRVLRAYPIVGHPLLSFPQLFPALARARQRHTEYTKNKTARQLDTPSDCETSATFLSGAAFYLLKDAAWIKKLQHGIRTRLCDESKISFLALGRLKTLNTVIQVTFRLYSPVPTMPPRLVSEGGAVINSVFIPARTRIGVAQYLACHSSHNFTDPERFAPERFLGHPKFQDDKRTVIQPFSTGPSNCVGQDLAWTETQAIMARLIWHFDMELDKNSLLWNRQKLFILRDKLALTAHG
ncbi:cytochrome P450 [Mytilinidion resinicola]|uniref:Cytochrome P450 n=1 Tax=Mytilinidion resinicola TaxID=574789 RepID=A0A6A6Z506_9PEZI|nr:cytochrome P450 [Mytilinidion resinicola]KAF2815337.1 cytochrome P450 [Mytilinidion resinicola]